MSEDRLVVVIKKIGIIIIGVTTAYFLMQVMSSLFAKYGLKAQASPITANIRTLNKSRLIVDNAVYEENTTVKEYSRIFPDYKEITYIEGIKIESFDYTKSNESADGTIGILLLGKAILEDGSEVIITPCINIYEYSGYREYKEATLRVMAVGDIGEGEGPIDCPYGVYNATRRVVERGDAVVRWVLDAVPNGVKIKGIKLEGFAYTDNPALEGSTVRVTVRITGLQA